jgi:2-polyprenyl-3-methyl-5-hydroxy-6-metoxy-1,4-benzoquinol methylase
MLRTSEAVGTRSARDYTLGYTTAEHERLIQQAALIAPITERLFREAGIGRGQRVLDLGSGMGDVSMLVARLVGPTGEVVGIERDEVSIARAQARADAAGLGNIRFAHTDVNDIRSSEPFDAVVGRFILMFLCDPLTVLRTALGLLRPGGILAFQEISWLPMLAMGSRLPLWSRMLTAIHETLLRAGANPEMGPELFRLFQNCGLPAPNMHMEALAGSNVEYARIMLGVLLSIRPLAGKHNVSLRALGNFESLPGRIQAEIDGAGAAVSFLPVVNTWLRKPE